MTATAAVTADMRQLWASLVCFGCDYPSCDVAIAIDQYVWWTRLEWERLEWERAL